MTEQIQEQAGTLVFTRSINAPVHQLYHAFTNATALREWLCDVASTSPREGGRLYVAWNNGYYASGEYTSLDRDRCIAFSWYGRGEPQPTQVEVTLSEKNSASEVNLQHSGLGAGEAWAAAARELRKGWETGLDNLKSVLETGEDLRLTRRPMLGITLGDFNPEVAQKLGVPATQGVRLDSTLEGMGAHAAGLQPGDVIVGLGDQTVRDFNDLAAALQGRFAGEQIDVTYYRGPEKMKTSMELSRRPVPEIPKSGLELAAMVREKYRQIDSELRNIFEGVTEEEAGFAPSPDEWSAKEIIAHLILGERFSSSYIVELVGGQERWADDFLSNNHDQTRAVVAAYPTVADLLDELRRNELETVALLETLPEDFVRRKGSYWRLAYGSIQPDYHAEQHYSQIRDAIEAARQK